MKNIYKLSQEVNTGWDTYDSMVIIADCEKEAILLSYEQADMLNKYPLEESYYYLKLEETFKEYNYVDMGRYSWAFEKDIKIICLGQANSNITDSKVVCASFNAG